MDLALASLSTGSSARPFAGVPSVGIIICVPPARARSSSISRTRRTPPAASEWLWEVLLAADLVLIPVRPSPDDLRSVGATLAAVNEATKPFAFVLSQTPRARITEEAVRVLAQHGRLAPVNIAQRVAYAETAATGQGVTETKDTKAGTEIVAVWDYVKGMLNA